MPRIRDAVAAADRSRRVVGAGARLAKDIRARQAPLPVLGSHGCWCGGPYCHDWPGKADGAPHPRDGA
jgi:hypothetical protein